jgi:threonine dehydratase
MLPTLAEVHGAQSRLRGIANRTPLVRLDLPDAPAEIWLKLENLQPIGSFKIRGAANAIAAIPTDRLAHGVLTASAGNMAQGAAWCARARGVPCTVIAPETAPVTKIRAIERLGGRVIRVPFDRWWRTFEERAYPGVEGSFVHAFDDPLVMAGNGTIGLEVLEDLPDPDAIVVPWGGGGLFSGIAAAVRSASPRTRLMTAECDAGAPLAASLAAGAPTAVPFRKSFVDGIGGPGVFPRMFERARSQIAAALVATVAEVASAVRILAERGRVIAEGAGACSLACALAGGAGSGRVVCVISGGNIDEGPLREALAGRVPI